MEYFSGGIGLRSAFESLLVFSIMTGMLLPVRMLFVAYISDNWFGSLGIISTVLISMVILTKKKKLGFFGPMFERQIYKFQKGKRGLIIFGESVFLLLILGVMIFAIEQGNSVYSNINIQVIKNPPSGDVDRILETAKDWNYYDWLTAFLRTPIAFLTAFPQMSVIIASIDQKLDGWLLHFYTVGFIEYLELLGILIFSKISFNRKPKSFILPNLQSKASGK